MANINLLPTELRPKGQILKASKILKKISLVALLVFIVFGVLVFGSLMFLSSSVKTSQADQNELKARVRALEQTEQGLVLVKDRLKKITKVTSLPNALDETRILGDVASVFEEGIVFKKAHAVADKINIVVVLNSSSDLAKFITSLVNSQKYKTIKIIKLDFSAARGYEVEFSLKE